MSPRIYTIVTVGACEKGNRLQFWCLAAESHDHARCLLENDSHFSRGWRAVFLLNDWAAEQSGPTRSMNIPDTDMSEDLYQRWARWATTSRFDDGEELGPTYEQLVF